MKAEVHFQGVDFQKQSLWEFLTIEKIPKKLKP